jgi:Tol biopolymer transport system component
VDVSQGTRAPLPAGIEPIGWLAGGRLLAYAFDRQGAGLAVLRPPFATVRVTARGSGAGSACFNGIGFGGALPDGRIVMTSGRGSQSPSDLWTVAVAGGPPRRLAGSPRTWEGSPSRSPGGDLLLFQRGDVLTHGGSCQGPLEPVLWVARADGSRARPLSRAPSEYGWEDTMAAWSSDGRRVAYLHQSLGGSEEDGVYVVDLAGGPPTRVAGRAGWPSWSPEGRELVLETEGGIEVVTADGRERRSLGAGRMPSWSPDGSAIALLRGRTVWTVEPDGGGVARKVVLAAWYPGGLARAVPYRWSPDGSRLALADERGIVVVRRDGGARRILAKRGAREVAWSPEGDRLAFTAVVGRIGRAERTELFVVGANGGAPVRLTRDLADVTGPAWASR